MKEYLIAVIGTVLLCAVLTAIVPNGKTAGVIKGTAKLACLLAIVAPIPTFLNGEKTWGKNLNKNVLQTDDAFIEYYSSMRITQAENVLQQELYDKFSVEATVSLQAKTDSTVLEIEAITVVLTNEIDKEVQSEMCEYLTKTYCSEVLIE